MLSLSERFLFYLIIHFSDFSSYLQTLREQNECASYVREAKARRKLDPGHVHITRNTSVTETQSYYMFFNVMHIAHSPHLWLIPKSLLLVCMIIERQQLLDIEFQNDKGLMMLYLLSKKKKKKKNE